MAHDHPSKPRFAFNVGIVGHRPDRLPEQARDAVAEHVALALRTVREAAEAAYARHRVCFDPGNPLLTLVCALAEGADSMAADAALAQAYTLDAVLPFPREDYETDFKADIQRAAFAARLDRARAVLELPGSRMDEGKAYEAAGLVVLDHADILIAVWDRAPARGRGGTPEFVAEAARRGMPIIEILADGSAPPQLRWQGLEAQQKLSPHVFDHPSAPLARLTQIVDASVKPPESKAESDGLRRFFAERRRRWNWRLLFPLTKAILFVQMPRRSDFEPRPPEALARDIAQANPGAASAITQAFGWADAVASYFVQIFRGAVIGNFVFAAAAVVAAALALVLESKTYALAELAIIFWVLFATSGGLKKHWHERWVEARELAERLRVAMAMTLLGTRSQIVYGEVQTWTGWFARAILRQSGLRSARLDAQALSRTKDALAGLLRDQIGYQAATRDRSHRMNGRLDKAGECLLGLTVLAIVTHLTLEIWPALLQDVIDPSNRQLSEALGAMSMTFPAMGAALFGIRMIGDFEGAAARADRMREQLGDLEATLAIMPHDYHRMRAVSHLVATIMLGDVESWRMSAESRGLPVTV
jgi:hypothetical protein